MTFWLVGAMFLAAGPNGSGADLGIEPSTPMVAGGQEAVECGWPDTVAVTGGGGLCTGTLVHPRLVTYAAHCGTNNKQIKFGEASSGEGVAYTRQVEYCRAHPDYQGVTNQSVDWAYCVLAEPITEIPFMPPLYGCELDVLEAGLEVVIAGFGDSSGTGGAGTKRWAWTEVVSTFGATVNIGGGGTSTCSGDSGGSALVPMPDGSWRALSMVSTGVGCGKAGVHALMHPAVPWIESESQIDITPCHDVEGNWKPNPNCSGFFAGDEAGAGGWDEWCDGTPRSGASETCGAPFDSIDDVTAPTINITSPSDGEMLATGTLVTVQIDAMDDEWGVKEVWVDINGMEQDVRDGYPPYEFADIPFPDGVYTITAHAVDWGDNMSSSDPVTIGINAEVPDEPETTGTDGNSGSSGGAGETGGGTTTSETTGSASAPTSTTEPEIADEDADGCTCRTTKRAGLGWWALMGLLIGLRRRRC